MPTYVYYDPETDEEIEIQHSMTEEPEVINQKTGNVMRRKITGGTTIIFRGDGWTGASAIRKDHNYHVDKQKDEIRGGVKQDPYKKHRDPGEGI